MVEWFKRIGFLKNPLTTRAVSKESKTLGYDKVSEEVIYHIEAGNMLFIEGESGSGKTTLLKELIQRFKGDGKVIYYSCAQIDDRFDLAKLIMYRPTLFGVKKVKTKQKDMILFLDEINTISDNNAERLKFYYDEGIIKSVIFAGTDYGKVNFNQSIKNRIGNRVIKLPKFTESQAKELIEQRLGEKSKMINKDVIKTIYKLSKGNPRLLLSNMEDVIKHVYQIGDNNITNEHVLKLFKVLK